MRLFAFSMVTWLLTSSVYAQSPADLDSVAYVFFDEQQPVKQQITIHAKAQPYDMEKGLFTFEENESFDATLSYVSRMPAPFWKSQEELLLESCLSQFHQTIKINGSIVKHLDSRSIIHSNPLYDNVWAILNLPILIRINETYARCYDWNIDDIVCEELGLNFYLTEPLLNQLFQPLLFLDHQDLYPGAIIQFETDCFLYFDLFEVMEVDSTILWSYHIQEIREECVFFKVDRQFLDLAKEVIPTTATYQAEGCFRLDNALHFNMTSHEEYPDIRGTLDVKIVSSD